MHEILIEKGDLDETVEVVNEPIQLHAHCLRFVSSNTLGGKNVTKGGTVGIMGLTLNRKKLLGVWKGT